MPRKSVRRKSVRRKSVRRKSVRRKVFVEYILEEERER